MNVLGAFCFVIYYWKAFDLTLFRMVFLELPTDGIGKSPSLNPATHIQHWWTLEQLYLTHRRLKNIWITWHTLWILLTLASFARNQQMLLYQGIQIKIAFWYIISNSFTFFWVFKNFVSKHGCNFDDFSKKGVLK